MIIKLILWCFRGINLFLGSVKMERRTRSTSKKKYVTDGETTSYFDDDIPDNEELEEIFGGSDFSDMDPTYVPDEQDLVTLEDLKGPVLEFIANMDSTSDHSEPESSPIIDVTNLLANTIPLESESVASWILEKIFIKVSRSDHSVAESLPIIDVENLPANHIPLESESVAAWILEKILIKVARSTKVLRRWRKPNPEQWSRNVAKKRRAEGLPYVTKKKLRVAKEPKPTDCSKCHFKCDTLFNEQARNKLCRHYWNLDFKGKKSFILSNIKIQDTKRVLVIRKSLKKARQYSKKCFFPDNEGKKQVCQKFFTKTLCIADSVINDAIQKRDDMGLYSKEDNRGRHTPPNKTNDLTIKAVKDHIESFPTMDPHYIRSTSKRKYLDKDLSIKKMYDLYVEQCEEKESENEDENELQIEKKTVVSEITYRRIFSTDYNLSFYVPKKDQCKACTNYEKASPENKQAMQKSYDEHIARKETVFKEKKKDKDRAKEEKNYHSATFDLQAVLQIPSGLVGQLYYCRKICVYNLCVYEAALPNEGYCFNWTEINGKRGSCEIGSVLYHYLSKCVPAHVTEVSLYSDTCGGQNRNQYICAILLYAVKTIEHIQTIDHKFLESGHSYMEVDSMHSSIESAKKHATVYSMLDFQSIFKRARKKQKVKVGTQTIVKNPYHTKEFKYHEFYDLKLLANKLYSNKKKDSEGNTVKWMKIKRFRYMKNEPKKIYFNYDLSETFVYMDMKDSSMKNHTRRSTRSKGACEQEPAALLKQLYEDPLPISQAKKKDLMKLCTSNVVPEELHGWYMSLRSDENMVDRIPEPDINEISDFEDE